MKKRISFVYQILFLLLWTVSPVAATSMSSTNYQISRAVFSSSGTPVSSTYFQLNSTLGQSTPLMNALDPPLSFTYDLYPGFWYALTTLESDEDDDGISDAVEMLSDCLDPEDADTDDDGIIDGMEDINHNGSVDPGETSPCDVDSDDDGIYDGTETGVTLGDIGSDTDTDIFIPDEDPDSQTLPLDDDTDNDGRLDGEEDKNFNGIMDPGETDPTKRNPKSMPWLFLLLDD